MDKLSVSDCLFDPGGLLRICGRTVDFEDIEAGSCKSLFRCARNLPALPRRMWGATNSESIAPALRSHAAGAPEPDRRPKSTVGLTHETYPNMRQSPHEYVSPHIEAHTPLTDLSRSSSSISRICFVKVIIPVA